MTERIFTFMDPVVQTEVRANSYPYGGGGPGVGVQLSLENFDGVTVVVRLPAEVARSLAASLLVAVRHPDDSGERSHLALEEPLAIRHESMVGHTRHPHDADWAP